ncbi:MAG: AraC family transcriptional regulator [Flavobacteriales bacterium]|jgi:AraC family transcriptional activator of pobA
MTSRSNQKPVAPPLPLHSLENNVLQLLPLDHTNPYDFKREHRHTYYEIMLIEEGGGNQLIDFRDYPALDNSCYIIFPRQVHLMNRRNSTGFIVQFTDDVLYNPELSAALRRLSLRDNSAIVFEAHANALKELSELYAILNRLAYAQSSTSQQVIRSVLHAFAALVVHHAGSSDESISAPDKKLLHDFFDLLEQHFTENRSVQFFVGELATTDKKLSAASQKYAGMSPLQVIHNRVLLEAKRMLLFEQPSHKEISFQLGFDSPASFSAFIKSKTGLTPSELSQQLAEIHK